MFVRQNNPISQTTRLSIQIKQLLKSPYHFLSIPAEPYPRSLTSKTFSRRGCYLLISHIKIHMNANDMYIGTLHPPTKDTIPTIALTTKPTLYNFFINYCSIVMNSGKGCSFFSILTASFSFAPAVTSSTLLSSGFSSIAGGSSMTNSSLLA